MAEVFDSDVDGSRLFLPDFRGQKAVAKDKTNPLVGAIEAAAPTAVDAIEGYISKKELDAAKSAASKDLEPLIAAADALSQTKIGNENVGVGRVYSRPVSEEDDAFLKEAKKYFSKLSLARKNGRAGSEYEILATAKLRQAIANNPSHREALVEFFQNELDENLIRGGVQGLLMDTTIPKVEEDDRTKRIRELSTAYVSSGRYPSMEAAVEAATELYDISVLVEAEAELAKNKASLASGKDEDLQDSIRLDFANQSTQIMDQIALSDFLNPDEVSKAEVRVRQVSQLFRAATETIKDESARRDQRDAIDSWENTAIKILGNKDLLDAMKKKSAFFAEIFKTEVQRVAPIMSAAFSLDNPAQIFPIMDYIEKVYKNPALEPALKQLGKSYPTATAGWVAQKATETYSRLMKGEQPPAPTTEADIFAFQHGVRALLENPNTPDEVKDKARRALEAIGPPGGEGTARSIESYNSPAALANLAVASDKEKKAYSDTVTRRTGQLNNRGKEIAKSAASGEYFITVRVINSTPGGSRRTDKIVFDITRNEEVAAKVEKDVGTSLFPRLEQRPVASLEPEIRSWLKEYTPILNQLLKVGPQVMGKSAVEYAAEVTRIFDTPAKEEKKETQAKPTSSKIDTNKPVIVNEDGSISTERVITIEADGKFVNIPTIVDGVQLSEDQAISLFQQGRNRPNSFHNTLQEAEEAAQSRSNEIAATRLNDDIREIISNISPDMDEVQLSTSLARAGADDEVVRAALVRLTNLKEVVSNAGR